MRLTSCLSPRAAASKGRQRTTPRWCGNFTSRSTISMWAADFVFPANRDFSRYKLLIVPALYIADDALLQPHLRLCEERRPCGDDLQERLRQSRTRPCAGCARRDRCARRRASATRSFPISSTRWRSKADPFHAGGDNQVSYWAEFLMPEHAKPRGLLRPSLFWTLAGHH